MLVFCKNLSRRNNDRKRIRKKVIIRNPSPLRKNMQDNRPQTVIGQLTERFNIQKIRRKICFHTVSVFIGGSTVFDNIIS
jgi:hypothetical protein